MTSLVLTREQGRESRELILALLASSVLALGFYRFGIASTSFVALLAILTVAGIYSTRVLTTALILLVSLPSFGAAIGVALPLGFEPLNLLILTGLAVAAVRGQHLFAFSSRVVGWLLLANLALFAVAWYRTYGQEEISLRDLAILGKPLLVIVAAFLAVRLLDPDKALGVVARALGFALLAIGISVLLHRLGVYSPLAETEITGAENPALGKYGGIVLHGNSAGLIVAAFTLPTYLLLKRSGAPRMGTALIVLAFPVLLTTISRGSLAVFGTLLVAFVVLGQGRVRNSVLVAGIAACALGWAFTAGGGEREFIVDSFERYRFDQNAQLNGRLEIWSAAGDYLEEPGRLLVGGGLDDFVEFSATTSLGSALSTHNVLLFSLTTGGLLMAGALVAVLAWLLLARGVPDSSVRLALRLAVIGVIVAGISSGDATLFNPITAFLWVLIALAYWPAPPSPTVRV